MSMTDLLRDVLTTVILVGNGHERTVNIVDGLYAVAASIERLAAAVESRGEE